MTDFANSPWGEALRDRESSNNYTSLNEFGYAGAYQLGKSALIDAGFKDRSGNWTKKAKSLGVYTLSDFLENPKAQDNAFNAFTTNQLKTIDKLYGEYYGREIQGITITRSGVLAGAHLVGVGKIGDFLKGIADPFDGNGVRASQYVKKFGQLSLDPPPQCFPASTPIAISLTQTKRIADIRVGDVVLAFDKKADRGRGTLLPRRVKRLYRNITREWIRLTWQEAGEPRELVATPGHTMLGVDGAFHKLAEMVIDGRVSLVLASGAVVEASAEHILYSAETASLFERAHAVDREFPGSVFISGYCRSRDVIVRSQPIH